jgi:hypothetical protein
MQWTASEVERLKNYLAQSLSFGAIAREFGTSRSAIAGKVNRLGPRPHVGASVQIQEVEEPVEPEEALPGYALLDLMDHQCRWPILDEPRFRFCGAPQAFPNRPNHNYCLHHGQLAFRVRPAGNGSD